ncbi:MAG: biotin--[acetyl-CoA-carboxylase] ligase [Granulosicoccaceae bacterium]
MTAEELPLREASIRHAAGQVADKVAIHIFEQLPSTNSWLLEHGAAGDTCLCIADRQMSGKGRRGRQWQSDGGGFTCSIRLSLQVPAAEAGAFSLVVALCLRDALIALGVSEVGLKWPNDLLHQWRKLSGILLEVAHSDERRIELVCGAGVNWRPLASDVDQPIIDVHTLAQASQLDRNHLAGYWLAAMLKAKQRYERDGFHAFAEQWRAGDLLHDASVLVLRGEQRLEGISRGVDASGALILENEHGVQQMHAGEVSLRRR